MEEIMRLMVILFWFFGCGDKEEDTAVVDTAESEESSEEDTSTEPEDTAEESDTAE